MQKIIQGRERTDTSRGALIFLILFIFTSVNTFSENLKKRHLVLCLDSIPYTVFTKAKDEGLFTKFRTPAKMISTFPALTNFAWSVILDAGEVEGYQTRYFDPELNKIEGGFKDLFKSKGFPNTFDYINENMMNQLKAYILGKSGIETRMKNLEKEVLLSDEPRLFYAFIGISDIVAHMKGEEGLLELLRTVDHHLGRIQEAHMSKFNESLEVTMLSDHASTMQKGRVINMYRILKDAGFNPVKSLNTADDVIYHTSGILSVAPFFVREPRRIELTQKLAQQPWADLAATYDKKSGIFLLLTSSGSLEAEYNKTDDTFRLRNLEGSDPLGLIERGLPLDSWIPQSDIFKASLRTAFPDSLKRIQMALNGDIVKYPASVLVSIKYGYESSSSRFMNFISGLKKNRRGTHGGLAALDSTGFLASTHQTFPEWVSAYEVPNKIKGFDFALRYEDMTVFWKDEEPSLMRLGQKLLNSPDAQSIQIRIKILANDKYTVSKPPDLFIRELFPKKTDNERQESRSYLDITLSNKIEIGYIYKIDAHILNSKNQIIASIHSSPFRISHARGYRRFPIKAYISPARPNTWKQRIRAK